MGKASTYYTGLPSWAKGVLAVSVVAAIAGISYVVYKKVKSSTDVKSSKEEVNSANQELNDLSQSGIKPTLSNFQVQQLSNKLFEAMDGAATDEDAIYEVLRLLKNDADFVLLSKTYGVKELSSGKFNPTPNFKGTLTSALTSELSSSERAEANKILASKGIKARI